MLVRRQTDGHLPPHPAAHPTHSCLLRQLDKDLKQRQETDWEAMEQRQLQERQSLEARYNLENNANAAAAEAAEARSFGDPLSSQVTRVRPIGAPAVSPLRVNSTSAGTAAASRSSDWTALLDSWTQDIQQGQRQLENGWDAIRQTEQRRLHEQLEETERRLQQAANVKDEALIECARCIALMEKSFAEKVAEIERILQQQAENQLILEQLTVRMSDSEQASARIELSVELQQEHQCLLQAQLQMRDSRHMQLQKNLAKQKQLNEKLREEHSAQAEELGNLEATNVEMRRGNEVHRTSILGKDVALLAKEVKLEELTIERAQHISKAQTWRRTLERSAVKMVRSPPKDRIKLLTKNGLYKFLYDECSDFGDSDSEMAQAGTVDCSSDDTAESTDSEPAVRPQRRAQPRNLLTSGRKQTLPALSRQVHVRPAVAYGPKDAVVDSKTELCFRQLAQFYIKLRRYYRLQTSSPLGTQAVQAMRAEVKQLTIDFEALWKAQKEVELPAASQASDAASICASSP